MHIFYLVWKYSYKSLEVLLKNIYIYTQGLFFFFLHFTFYNYVIPLGFLPWEIRVAFPWEKPTATPNLLCVLGVLVFP